MADQYRDRPFPADDDFDREQPRTGSQQQGASDPLAELARLIGQAEPGYTARQQPQQEQPRDPYDAHDQYDARDPAVEEEDVPAIRPSWVQNLAARHAHQEDPYREEERYDPRYAEAPHQQPQMPYERPAPEFDHTGYAPLPGQGRGQQLAASDRYDDALYGRPDHDPALDANYAAQGEHYDDGGYDRPPYGEDFDQDAPKQRRGGTMTVVVVLLLAVVGTGAAFAYRTFVGSPRSGEPPVIKADVTPSKIIPAGAAGDGSGKQITDRLGDKPAERMVSREEQPVDINARTGPRVVFPPLTQNANPPSISSASMNVRPTGAGIGNGTLSGEEPRKIRTLSIRPDQSSDTANAAPAVAPRQQAPAPVQQQRAPAPASTASTGAPPANAPVSLAPQAAAAAEPRSRVAAISPAAVTGGAFVQVSSQRSEADAKASFRAIQRKYSGILGSRTASIQRADIAGKGTFYRAMVGPFGSNDEAAQLCMSLKSAGGQCIVQRH